MDIGPKHHGIRDRNRSYGARDALVSPQSEPCHGSQIANEPCRGFQIETR